jgi:N-acetylneuraminic acid mutarotase
MEWKLKKTEGDIPEERSRPSASFHGEDLYIYGGRGYDKDKMGNIDYDDLYKFESDTLTWEKVKTSGNGPGKRRFHQSVIIYDKLFILGGLGDNMKKIYYLDLNTRLWGCVPLPENIVLNENNFSICNHEKHLFLFPNE